MTLKEKREARAKAIADARAVLNKADAEKRSLNAEETSAYDKAWAEQERLATEIEREERLLTAENSMTQPAGTTRATAAAPVQTGDAKNVEQEARSKAFTRYLRHGNSALSEAEVRALQASVPSEGGYLVGPEQFVNDLIQNITDAVHIRKRAKVYQLVTAASLGVPAIDTGMSDAEWTSELTTGAVDTALRFGKRALNPSPLSKLAKISERLIRLASQDVQGIVRDELARKFTAAEENGFVNGTGSNQPLGFMVASDDGVPTSRDVSSGNTTTAPTFDGLINCKYALKSAYHANAEWMMHRDVVKVIAKIKDGDGQYIWESSKKVGDPDVLLGNRLIHSEYMPNTLTSGLYIGMFADFSKYSIAESLQFGVQVLNELYAATNQIGYKGYQEIDGMPVLAEAFSRLKLA